ncbi:hypothetical protein QR680_008609 [Steinernema hermaphroditum]|uniref:Piwi domain-containing protein n=1 Tax=Steinernema hermaphroditum TaxID=289476 RepID=A0AA39M7B5_9BILA|nr:hypothetical protein QR680_008609 [Steinernema hermaphroditum]
MTSKAAPSTSCGNLFPPKLAPVQAPPNRRVKLVTNHFELTPSERWIYRYDVSIVQKVPISAGLSKEIDWCRNSADSVKRFERHTVNLALLRRAFEMTQFASRETVITYDNCKALFSCEKLKEDRCAQITIEGGDIPESFRDDPRLSRGQFTLSIVPVTEGAHRFKADDLKKAVDKNQEDHSLRQFYEILTNQKAVSEQTHAVFHGTLFEVPSASEKQKILVDGCHIVSGISKSARVVGDGKNLKPTLVLDSQKAPFYNESSPEGLVSNVRDLIGDKEVLTNGDRQRVLDFFRNVTLVHLNNKALEFKLVELSSKPVSDIMFTDNSGRRTSVLEYHRKLGVKIVKPKWPAIAKATNRDKMVYFPMEVLGIKAGQVVSSSRLTPRQTAAILKEASNPKDRFEEIRAARDELHLDAEHNEYLQQHRVQVSAKPMEVEAYRQQPPNVIYSGGKAKVNEWKAKWFHGKYVVPAKVDKFFLLFNNQDRFIRREEVEKFKKGFLAECSEKGMAFPEPSLLGINLNDLEKFMMEQEEAVKKTKNLKVFVMLIDSDRSRSHRALKYNEAVHQILTQQVTYEVAKKCLFKKDILQNIVAKTNEKCFGQNYNIQSDGFIPMENTLVMAYDVRHPTGAGQSALERRLGLPEKTPSVVGFSFNGGVTAHSFIGDYAFQEPRQERVDILASYTQWMLGVFQRSRGKLPSKIAVVRDGVSEGQMKMVLQHEVEDIRKGCAAFKQGYRPKMMVVMVNKRHNKRAVKADANGNVENPPPGTVIDSKITRPDVTEIFMLPHSVPRGTAKIPEYSLLLNEFGQPPSDKTSKWLVSFLTGLCYSHQIIPAAISIPEPVFQADEWAKRGDENLKEFQTLKEGNQFLMNAYIIEAKNPQTREMKKTYDWDALTQRFGYRGKRLEGTRANA